MGHGEQGGATEAGWGPGQKGKGPMWVSRDYKERQAHRDQVRETLRGPCKDTDSETQEETPLE